MRSWGVSHSTERQAGPPEPASNPSQQDIPQQQEVPAEADGSRIARLRGLTGPLLLEGSPPRDPLVGSTLDRYEVLRRIGEGAMGAVYEVRHRGLGRRLAMKVIHGELAQVPEFTARFAQEARACSVLNHPNCIQVSDFGRASTGQLFLVMEFVSGRPLNELLRFEPLPMAMALEICRQVLSGLAHAHALGIVHRDIKLDNVMLLDGDKERPLCKILDFGVAKVPMQSGGRLTQAGVIFGTPEYMAPEQVMTTQVDERADLYAVGVLLWCMLVGRAPLEAEGHVELLNLKLTMPAPRLGTAYPGRFPDALSGFLAKALEREPSARFSSAGQMLDALDVLDLVPGRSLSREVRSPAWRAAKKAATWPFGYLRRALRWAGSHLQAWYHCDDDLTHMPSWSLRMRLLRSTRRGHGIVLAALVLSGALALLLGRGARPSDSIGWSAEFSTSLEKRLLQVRLFLAKGACREAAIDLKNLLQHQPRLVPAHYLLGAAELCRGHYQLAFRAYSLAIEHQPSYRSDARIVEDTEAALKPGVPPAARLAALAFADEQLGTKGLKILLEAAASHPDGALRAAAIARVKRRGIGPNIDWVKSLSLDLDQASSCRARAALAERLRKLADRRALPALRRARQGAGCARRQIDRGIRELSALPPLPQSRPHRASRPPTRPRS